MGYPVNPELTRRIVNDAFYAEIEAAAQERLYPLISEEIQQDVVTVIRPSMGAVPKPTQLSGTASGGSGAREKQMKDYKYTTTVHEWDLTVTQPRSVAEDLPEEMARISRNLGASATVFFDEHAVRQLDSTTDFGYDQRPLFDASHAEAAGLPSPDDAFATQSNTHTAATDPLLPADIESSIETQLKALRNFRDDQGRPVNEGVTRFTILLSPLEEWAYQGILNPTRSAQAIEGTIHSCGGMLFLQQAPPQVEARVGAAREGAERGAVRRLEVSQLPQPLEYQGRDLAPDDEIEPR